jgi:hypothetical protein
MGVPRGQDLGQRSFDGEFRWHKGGFRPTFYLPPPTIAHDSLVEEVACEMAILRHTEPPGSEWNPKCFI